MIAYQDGRQNGAHLTVFSIVDTITNKPAVLSKFHMFIDYLGQYPTRLAAKMSAPVRSQ